ncbi:unnamed protein product, partial [Linum tenue]
QPLRILVAIVSTFFSTLQIAIYPFVSNHHPKSKFMSFKHYDIDVDFILPRRRSFPLQQPSLSSPGTLVQVLFCTSLGRSSGPKGSCFAGEGVGQDNFGCPTLPHEKQKRGSFSYLILNFMISPCTFNLNSCLSRALMSLLILNRRKSSLKTSTLLSTQIR